MGRGGGGGILPIPSHLLKSYSSFCQNHMDVSNDNRNIRATCIKMMACCVHKKSICVKTSPLHYHSLNVTMNQRYAQFIFLINNQHTNMIFITR